MSSPLQLPAEKKKNPSRGSGGVPGTSDSPRAAAAALVAGTQLPHHKALEGAGQLYRIARYCLVPH